MENLHLGNGILMLPLSKKNIKSGHHFINMCHMETFQITDPLQSWVFGVLRVTEMEYQQ